MPSDLDDMLARALDAPDTLPDADATWAAGTALRRRRQAIVTGASGLLAAVVMTTVIVRPGPDTPTPIVSDPSEDASPAPVDDTAPGDGSEPDTVPDNPPVDVVTVATTPTSLTRYPAGETVKLPDGAAIAYPDRLFGLADGTVAWQADGSVWVLAPGADTATILLDLTSEDDTRQLTLTGTGEVAGAPVVLVTREFGDAELQGGGIGRIDAVRLDGSHEVLRTYDGTWEYGEHATSYLDGWLLYTEQGIDRAPDVLVAPDGTRTEFLFRHDVPQVWTSDGSRVLARVRGHDAPVLVTEYTTHDLDTVTDAWLEIVDVDDVGTGPPWDASDARRIPLPVDQGVIRKQLQVAGGLAWFSLLPERPIVQRVDLATGAVDEFAGPGVLAAHGRATIGSTAAATGIGVRGTASSEDGTAEWILFDDGSYWLREDTAPGNGHASGYDASTRTLYLYAPEDGAVSSSLTVVTSVLPGTTSATSFAARDAWLRLDLVELSRAGVLDEDGLLTVPEPTNPDEWVDVHTEAEHDADLPVLTSVTQRRGVGRLFTTTFSTPERYDGPSVSALVAALPATTETLATDRGWTDVSDSDPATLVDYTPRTLPAPPDGYALEAVHIHREPLPSGPELTNPEAGDVLVWTYRSGLDTISITNRPRTVEDATKGWANPELRYDGGYVDLGTVGGFTIHAERYTGLSAWAERDETVVTVATNAGADALRAVLATLTQ